MVDPFAGGCHPLELVSDILHSTVDTCKMITKKNGGPGRSTTTIQCYDDGSNRSSGSYYDEYETETTIVIEPDDNELGTNKTKLVVRDGEIEKWFMENNIIEPNICDYIHARIDFGYKVKYIKYNNKRTKVKVRYIAEEDDVIDIYTIE